MHVSMRITWPTIPMYAPGLTRKETEDRIAMTIIVVRRDMRKASCSLTLAA